MPSFHVTFALLFGQWNQVEETSLDSYYEETRISRTASLADNGSHVIVGACFALPISTVQAPSDSHRSSCLQENRGWPTPFGHSIASHGRLAQRRAQ